MIDHDDHALDSDSMGNSFYPAQGHHDGDIQVEYHPNSGHGTKIFQPDEYYKPVQNADTAVEPEPWAPFRTREDFEFAEIALETGMTRKQMDAMIKLFHKCIEIGEGGFTISGHKDMEDTLKVAANRLTKVW